MLNVVTWKWGTLFGVEYANKLRNMVARHLHVPHKFICVTDDTEGLDPRIKTVPLPNTELVDAHCSIRMKQFSHEMGAVLGPRSLMLDLDVVIVNDITPLVQRTEPLVMWYVGYAKLYAGGIILSNAGVLDGLWSEYAADPVALHEKAKAWPGGSKDGSDQDMINYYLDREKIVPGRWVDSDGLFAHGGIRAGAFKKKKVTGGRMEPVWAWVCQRCDKNYTDKVATGEDTWAARVSNPFTPRACFDCAGKLVTRTGAKYTTDPGFVQAYDPKTAMPALPVGARLVAIGHRDKVILEETAHRWVKEHWR